MKRILAPAFMSALATQLVHAQVPVIDQANVSIARENAANTGKIVTSNAEIQKLSQEILKAVTGQRKSEAELGSLLQAGLGGGNSVASAPSWGNLMGGKLSFDGLGGNAQNIASEIINKLQLVKTIAGIFQNGKQSPLDASYMGSVNTATLLSALTSQASAGVKSRAESFNSAAGQIGSTSDIKGSIDQNTQIQAQTGLTVNELISVTNGAVAALNAEQIRRVTQQSMVSNMLKYEPSNSDPFK